MSEEVEGTITAEVKQEMEDTVISSEKAEEAKLMAWYPNLAATPGGSDLLGKRLQNGEAKKESQPQWPESGGEWSDEEDWTMAEEDEAISVHNEEKFGMEDPSADVRQFGEPLPLRAPPAQHGRYSALRGGLGRGQMFEDPAVMRTVEGTPSIKTLDSAIVDLGNTMCHKSFDDDMHTSMVGRWPIFSRQPLTPRLYYNQQKGGFMLCPPTPKMMQLRFGANSPRPSAFYSPSSNPVQHFRTTEDWDAYCNLMTAKEKEPITRLQSENPYHDDYNYQEYFRRIDAKMAEKELGTRSKRELPKLTTPYITKTDVHAPVKHFEGSLGQVAVSTCHSPRRAISAVNAVQTQGPLEEMKVIKLQRLEVLGQIEKLFLVLLEVEEAERMKTPLLSEAEERRIMEKCQGKVEHIYSQLQHHSTLDSGVEFLPFLLVSKGKRLLARLLPFLKDNAALKILSIVTSNLPALMSRDSEEALPVLYPPLGKVIGGLAFSQLIGVLKELTTYESLTLACQNKFGLSLLYALLSQGEKLLSSDIPLEPSIGDFETWTDTIFQVAGQLSKPSLVEPLLMPSNLLTLFCRYLDKRTVHQLKSNKESATGYLALAS